MERAIQETETDSLLMKFFVNELKDIYWAEEYLVKTLPKMAQKATTNKLAMAFQNHCRETETHVCRLERIFEIIGEKPYTKKCEAMIGIINEGESIIPDTKADTMTRDVELIFAGLKAEHYEIATYGGLIAVANTLGLPNVAELLILTLEDEEKADELLTQIAESSIRKRKSPILIL
jgi:ferritin-like metal-binding protein YciE